MMSATRVLCAGTCVLALVLALVRASPAQHSVVDGVWDAENQLFTPDGRLFVTGGDNVYEITRGAGSFHKTPLFPAGAGYFLGITRWRGHLVTAYQSAGRNVVAAAPLRAGSTPQFVEVWELQGFTLPNGVETLGDHVLISDSAMGAHVTSSGRIVALDMVESDDGATARVTAQRDVVTEAHGLTHPNGLLVVGHDTLYFTDLSGVTAHVRRIAMDAATATPREATAASVFSRVTVLDDLGVLTQPSTPRVLIAVCDYMRSQVLVLDAKSGAVVESSALFAFRGPSSVQQGVPPMFAPGELVVTNKGVVRSHLPVGNFVGTWAWKE